MPHLRVTIILADGLHALLLSANTINAPSYKVRQVITTSVLRQHPFTDRLDRLYVFSGKPTGDDLNIDVGGANPECCRISPDFCRALMHEHGSKIK